MGSTRLPGKPLIDILGLPMVEHVRRRVGLSPIIDEVIVATCDREIADVVERYGGRAVMTSDRHERCTDRVAEAARAIDADIVINVQGDEPLLRPESFDGLLAPLGADPSLPCTNLMAVIVDDAEFTSLNVVKVVVRRSGDALYFSREPVPSSRRAGGAAIPRLKQLGIIAFRSGFLARFALLEPGPLEVIESVDMLRALEHGYRVHMVLSPAAAIGVDTPADLERAIALMSQDDLAPRYLNRRARELR
jgi:3-deoxy-manno-octulosonate cytidylyltransferase (CMP-KDO synthetase)